MNYPEYAATFEAEANYSFNEPHALDDLWNRLSSFGNQIPYPENLAINFELKKEIFFYILRMLMSDGRLRLAKNGQFLVGSIDEQLEKLKKVFPESEESQKGIGGISTWFFMDQCPAGAVWVYQLEDGKEYLEWT